MILQRYILKDLWMVFGMSLMAITMISMVAFLFQFLRSYENLGLAFAAQFIVITLGSYLPYIIPVAATMSATFVFSRLSARNEILAMKAAGIASHRIVAPAILFGLSLCLVSMYLYHVITPESHHARRQALHAAVKAVLKSPPPETGSRPIKNYRISYQEFSEGTFQYPFITEFNTAGHRVREILALEARVVWNPQDDPELILTNATIRTFQDGVHVSTSSAETSEIKGTLSLEDPDVRSKKPAGMTALELQMMARTHPEPHQRNRARFELYVRHASSFAPLILVMMGLVVGMVVTRGSKLVGMGASIPILFLYFLLTLVAESMTDRAPFNVALLAFAPLIIMALMIVYPAFRLYRN